MFWCRTPNRLFRSVLSTCEMSSPGLESTLVGLCDGQIDPRRHRTSYLVNKVGGPPDWSPVTSLQTPRCGCCGAPLAHVVQVYCPLQASPYHRNLYLFACPGVRCSGGSDSWTVLRSQCLEEEAAAGTPSRPAPAQDAPLSATDWCDSADDWGMEEEEEEEGDGWGGGVKKENQDQEEAAAPEPEDVSRQLQDLSLGQSQEDAPVLLGLSQQDVPVLLGLSQEDRSVLLGQSQEDRSVLLGLSQEDRSVLLGQSQEDAPVLLGLSQEDAPVLLGLSQQDVPVLRPFFVSVVEESDLGGEEDDLQHAQQLLRDYERREGVAVGELEDDGEGGGEEKYEKTRARHGDAVFSRFMKKISLCPQQILRYCRGGKPLFISEPPSNMAQVVSACGACGGSRTFELQLMPALVSLLRRTDASGAEVELEFGTVLVYTCTNSCWTAGSGSVLEEFCLVQSDPDQQLFK